MRWELENLRIEFIFIRENIKSDSNIDLLAYIVVKLFWYMPINV